MDERMIFSGFGGQGLMTRDMVYHGSDPHVVATSRPFIAAYVAEWIMDQTWPPPTRMDRMDVRP
ncbi:MAG TPA: hypothetical protein VM219_09825 [Phycisphaerae bacterium]|nr:hypothetical protein [Phycisphaerae bacterium]